MLKLYTELAAWWPLVSRPEDYAEEAAFFGRIFRQSDLPGSAALLELGCGGGNNASFLKKMFAQVTLTDLSPGMLAVSRGLNPECEHAQGDMRTLRLGRVFDAVFIHDAVGYMSTPADLRAALETAFVHCKPGGVALFVPDHTCETFEPTTNHHGHDGEDRAIRYLEWTFDPDETDTAYTTEYAYILREAGQPVRVEHETHLIGLFPRAFWMDTLREIGFTPERIEDDYNRDLFVGRRGESKA